MTIRSMYVYNGATWDEVGYTVSHDIPADGTTGQVLAKVSATDYDTAWADPDRFTVNAKGDLLVGTAADTVGRLAVGADGDYLAASSSASAGVEWRTGGPPIAIGDYWVTSYNNTQATAQTADGRVIYEPIFVPKAMTISEVRIVVGAAADAGRTWRLGLYTPAASGIPGSLLADFGTVAAGSTGVKAITGLSVALPAGLLWGCYAVQGTVGATGGAFYTSQFPTHGHFSIASAYGPSFAYIRGYYQESVTGSLPSSPGTLLPTSQSGILMQFKRSA